MSSEPKEGILFRIFAEGDRTVGDGLLEAVVVIPHLLIHDEDRVQGAREALEEAFEKIFDSRRVRVMTREEYKKFEEEEE
jgi:hypothetical protein